MSLKKEYYVALPCIMGAILKTYLSRSRKYLFSMKYLFTVSHLAILV